MPRRNDQRVVRHISLAGSGRGPTTDSMATRYCGFDVWRAPVHWGIAGVTKQQNHHLTAKPIRNPCPQRFACPSSPLSWDSPTKRRSISVSPSVSGSRRIRRVSRTPKQTACAVRPSVKVSSATSSRSSLRRRGRRRPLNRWSPTRRPPLSPLWQKPWPPSLSRRLRRPSAKPRLRWLLLSPLSLWPRRLLSLRPSPPWQLKRLFRRVRRRPLLLRRAQCRKRRKRRQCRRRRK